MKNEYVSAEKELALEAWMNQTFRLDDKLLEEGLDLGEWLVAEIRWFELN